MSGADLRAIARALGGEVSGGQVLAPGPGHSPADRSLSVKINSAGGLVVNSFSPGDDWKRCKDYVREKIGAEPFAAKSNSVSTAPKVNGTGSTERKISALYDYTDEHGELLFQVVRFEPKTFRQRHSDGYDGWTWRLEGVRRVLYRLPELLEAVATEHPIFIAEGEKAVDALINLGVRATCSPMGAGKWRESYNDTLKDADVITLPDNDAPGRKHVEMVTKALTGVAAHVRSLTLPGLPEGGDAFDWIKSGGTAEQLWKLLKETPQNYVTSNQSAAANGSHLVTRCAADIEPEPIEWLWPDRIARGKQTAIAGEPGLGKSQLGIDIGATVTRGGAWPNNEGHSPRGRLIILSAEDDAADTILPRLIAAQADLASVEIIQAVQKEDGKAHRTFSLQTDLALLEAKIAHLGNVRLVLIDPISAYFGKGVDSHKDVDVRTVLAPVTEMANRLHVAILTIAHFNKASGPTNTKALHKFMGSIAFVAAPRVAFAVIEDAEDNSRRLFLHAKNNLAPPPPGLAFRIKQVPLAESRISASRVAWEAEPVTMTADEAVAASKTRETAPALDEAKQFLASIVGSDGLGVKEIEAEAKAAGLSLRTVRRAKDELGFKSVKSGFSGWLWKR
jgi:putative DNA primase/helicase